MMQISIDNLPKKIDYSQNSLLEMVSDEKGINIMKAAMFENIAARTNEKRKFMQSGGQQGVNDDHNFAVVLVIYQDPITKQLKKEPFASYSKGLRTDGRNHAEQIAWRAAKSAMKAIIEKGGEIKRIAIASDLSLCVNKEYRNVCQVYFSGGGGATIGNPFNELVFNQNRDKICYSVQGSLEDVKEMVDELASPNTIENLKKELEAFKKNRETNLTKIRNQEDKDGKLLKSNKRLEMSIKDYEEKIKNLEVESKNQAEALTKAQSNTSFLTGSKAKPPVNVKDRNSLFDAQKNLTNPAPISATKLEAGKPMLSALELQKERSQEKETDENNQSQDISAPEIPKKPPSKKQGDAP
jgi:hypothetical protein